MTNVLILLTLQGLLGAFDNIYHHLLTEKLHTRPTAKGELALHTVREVIYAILFIGLAWLTWNGTWAYVLAVLMIIEVVITLWDFIIEDQTRKLPPLERVLHTVLAMMFGGLLFLFTPILLTWMAAPTGFTIVNYGILSWILSAYGMGVGVWALWDLVQVTRMLVPHWQKDPIQKGHKSNPQTILVTGGTGFIGKHLVRTLIKRGDKVLLYARDTAKAVDLFGPHIATVNDLEVISTQTPIDAVINLAGEPIVGGLWTQRRKTKLIQSRVDTTHALTTLITRLHHRPKVVVSGSAIGIYGNRGDEELTERSTDGKGFPTTLCQAWEKAAQPITDLGVRLVILRIGLVFGRDGGAFPQMTFPIRCGAGAVLGMGRQWMSWIHVHDLVRMILFAMDDREVAGTFNATAPNAERNVHFTKTVAMALNRPLFLRIPAWPVKTMLGELADLFVEGQHVRPRGITHLGFTYDYPTLDQALVELCNLERGKAPSEARDVFYNDSCPICRFEIDHYKDQAKNHELKLNFRGALANADDVRAYGLTDEDLLQRMYVKNQHGDLRSGVDAFEAVWSIIPRYRILARLLRIPPLRLLATLLYEGLMAPALYTWDKRRRHREKEKEMIFHG